MYRSATVKGVATTFALVFAALGLVAFSAPAARAEVSLTYCEAVVVAPGHYCTKPPGNLTDPCNIMHSWGGWTENYANTWEEGRFPHMYGYVQHYPGGCGGATDVCYFYSETLHHMNDGGCAGEYSWDVGEDVDLVVGIGLNGTYSWTISGAGHYP
jgi:hypothetical protein